MNIRRMIIGICSCLLIFMGCSTKNPDAPGTNQVHVENYILNHAGEADADIERCQVCHGIQLTGGNEVPGCFSCHTEGQSFTIHPLPYSDPVDHGAAGRDELAGCFGCHGTPPNVFDGGILADPDVYNRPSTNCSAPSCHPDAGAHPTRWQGDNDITPDYLSTHRTTSLTSVKKGCALCHQISIGGSQPLPEAPSCFSAGFTNSDNVTTTCHATGYVPAHDRPFTDPNDHGGPAKSDLSACQECHGTPGTTFFDGGGAPTACSSSACHPDAGAHPTRWQGENDITPDYLSTHRTIGQTSIEAGCALCHQVSDGGSQPLPEAPSCFSAEFTNSDSVISSCHPAGFVPAHGLPYTDPDDHGGPAKSNLSACQQCHGTPGTIFFDGGSASTACSTTACHPDAGAHPTVWRSGHRSAGGMTSNCTICHDVIRGRTAPDADAPSCYAGSFTNSDGITSGCHSDGPDD